MRRPFRQRYDPSSAGVIQLPPLLYTIGKRGSAYLYGSFSTPYVRCPLKAGAHQPIRVVDAIKMTIIIPIPPVEPQRSHVGYYCYILMLNDTNRLVCTGSKWETA
ncbi:hypothetical protein AVEN_157299-1, partial [Araneus ventricosus]